MKTSIKVLVVSLAVAAAFGTIRVASAGKKQLYEVSVDTAQRKAKGAIGDARNSADSSQLVTVTLSAMGNPSFKSALVAFKDANNVLGTCWTTVPAFIEVLQAVKSDSLLEVQWDAGGQCTSVNVYTSSTHSVKAP